MYLGQCEITRETEKAICVNYTGEQAGSRERQLWIPRSVAKLDHYGKSDSGIASACVHVPQWFVNKNGIKR
jgi:hypothetical protein